MVMAYLGAAMFILILLVLIPLLRTLNSPVAFALMGAAFVVGSFAVFIDGCFYLNFNCAQRRVFVQQRMCCGCCICGNKGFQGEELGDLDTFVEAEKIKAD